MRAAGQRNAGLQEFSEVRKGDPIFCVIEKASIEADLRKYECRIEFMLLKERRDREKRPHSDVSA